jgi:hypothetical protein
VENIEVLSVTFFNTLLKYRERCERKQKSVYSSYSDWHKWNFSRNHEVTRRIEEELSESFLNEEKRIFDIWIDFPVQTTISTA